MGGVCPQGGTFVFEERKSCLIVEYRLKTPCVGELITLDAIGPDGRPAACVEHPILQTCEIRVDGHFAAQSIELENEVGFSKSAD